MKPVHVGYIPVLHAGEFGGGLLQVVVVTVGEGAQAAGDQSHGAEACPRLAGRVGAGGVLLDVLAIPGRLQAVVRACEGHLHDGPLLESVWRRLRVSLWTSGGAPRACSPPLPRASAVVRPVEGGVVVKWSCENERKSSPPAGFSPGTVRDRRVKQHIHCRLPSGLVV